MSNNKEDSVSATTRREFVGTLGAVALFANARTTLAAEDIAGKIYGVYSGTDGKSYVSQLTGSGPIPAYRMQVGGPLLETAERRVSAFWGGVTFLLSGQIRVDVTGGSTRSVVGTPGDAFVFIDTRGDGHSVTRVGSEPLLHVSVRLKEPWSALSKAFSWPDDVVPPDEYEPAVNF